MTDNFTAIHAMEGRRAEGNILATSNHEEEIKGDTEREAQDFLDDWELQKFLISDEKLREIKDESGSCKNSK